KIHFSAASTHHLIHLMASFSPLFPGLTAGDSISPDQDQLTGTEGKSVKMKCNYQTDYTPWLYWYKHDSDLQAPQFILRKGGKGSTSEHIPDKRYESRTTDTSTELTIRELYKNLETDMGLLFKEEGSGFQ
uniref:Immunoglobulin V-set domain-containing protein n=1 Tax=Oryzias sinensis TaxID=183150 RepID=A0A8C7WS66_9TELE